MIHLICLAKIIQSTHTSRQNSRTVLMTLVFRAMHLDLVMTGHFEIGI